MKNTITTLTRSRVLSALLLVFMSIGVGILSLHFAAVLRNDEMFPSYLSNWWIVFLNIVPCIWLTLFFWFITRRAAVSFGLSSVIIMGLTLTSWFKLQFRNDPLFFEDILLVKEAQNMSGRYDLFITKSMIVLVVLLVAATIFLALTARGKPRGKTRLIGLITMLAFLVPARALYINDDIYTTKTANYDLINRWSSTQLYISKGFVYPFLYSARSAIDSPPKGYRAQDAKDILSQYEDADIPEKEKVDILGIQLEAYADFSVYDQIPFSADPYTEYHKLEAEGISGNLLTNIFAGGTINTERCFLTGYSDLGSFRTPTNSYVRYFADQGYTVTGSHPSYDWFYNRVNINANLGFENYKFIENHYGALTNNEVAMDRILFPELINLYEKETAESDKPYFSFSVTYQGHGPYTKSRNDYPQTYIKPSVYSSQSEHILNNYFGSIADTNEHLKDFFDYYRQSDRPVIIVLFGDHKPWLGDNSSVYKELGIDLNFSDPDSSDPETNFRNYYTTRYLIWANNSAKAILGNDFTGKGADVGPYFLMSELFRQCDWKGPAYMQAVNDVSLAVPVINSSGLFLEDGGSLTNDPSEENKKLIRQYRTLEYYERKNFNK